jgi:outer membrane protein assembly factor BamB
MSLLIAVVAHGDDWSQFRGSVNSGVATTANLPLEWGPNDHIAWSVQLSGLGWSQPVSWGDKIFVTVAESDGRAKPDPNNRGPGFDGFLGLLASSGLKPPQINCRSKVLCLDAETGQTLWEQVAREGRPTMQIHPNNTYASETPVTDGERVIAYFGMTGVYCYDYSGNLLWSRDLGAFPMQFGWGTGSSPILLGQYVYIQCDNEQSSFLVALDKSTGEPAWRVERDEKSNWSTPYLWRNRMRTELITAGGGQMRAYDPTTGVALWSMAGSGRTSVTPVGDEDFLYVDSADRLTGNTGALTAIRPGGAGEVVFPTKDANETQIAWSAKLSGSRVASPLLYMGCLYVLDNQTGIVRCLDAKTGHEHYRKRLPGASGFTSSPIANNGNVYFLDQSGRVFVVAAGPDLKIVATNELPEMCWASPGVAGDRLLIRTAEHLYAVSAKSARSP